MEKLKTFIVRVLNGKPAFRSEYHRQLFWKFFAQYEGKEIALNIDPRLPKRSLRQNNYYWLYINRIAESTGNDVKAVHEWAKEYCHPQGVKNEVVFGKYVTVSNSTTDLSRAGFMEFILNIEGETGIQAPDPEPFSLPLLHSEYEHMVEEGIIT